VRRIQRELALPRYLVRRSAPPHLHAFTSAATDWQGSAGLVSNGQSEAAVAAAPGVHSVDSFQAGLHEPPTLNSPETLNPKPSTLYPKVEAPNPKRLNPTPYTLHPKP
jgi:hypothetical protein